MRLNLFLLESFSDYLLQNHKKWDIFNLDFIITVTDYFLFFMLNTCVFIFLLIVLANRDKDRFYLDENF